MNIVITRLLSINYAAIVIKKINKNKPDQDGLLQEIFVKSFSYLY